LFQLSTKNVLTKGLFLNSVVFTKFWTLLIEKKIIPLPRL